MANPIGGWFGAQRSVPSAAPFSTSRPPSSLVSPSISSSSKTPPCSPASASKPSEARSQSTADQRWRNLAQTLLHHLRVDAYSHLQQLEIAYFEESSTGTLLSILNDDINQLERFLNTGARDLISFVTRVVAVGLSFVLLAPGIAWLAMVPIPFILWGTFWFQQQLAPRYEQVRERNGLISDRITNNLSGIATI